MEEEKVLTVKEAAETLGVHTTAVYQAILEGRLPHVTILGRIGVRAEDVKHYVPRAYRERPGSKAKGGRPKNKG